VEEGARNTQKQHFRFHMSTPDSYACSTRTFPQSAGGLIARARERSCTVVLPPVSFVPHSHSFSRRSPPFPLLLFRMNALAVVCAVLLPPLTTSLRLRSVREPPSLQLGTLSGCALQGLCALPPSEAQERASERLLGARPERSAARGHVRSVGRLSGAKWDSTRISVK
jgi:hypothetical protein